MTCTKCGCTEELACPDDCYWVFTDPPVCSACVFKAIATNAAMWDENRRFYAAQELVDLADRIHPEHDQNVALFEEAQEAIENADYEVRPPPRLWRPGDPIE